MCVCVCVCVCVYVCEKDRQTDRKYVDIADTNKSVENTSVCRLSGHSARISARSQQEFWNTIHIMLRTSQSTVTSSRDHILLVAARYSLLAVQAVVHD